MQDLTEAEVRDMFVNPFYAITLNVNLFETHTPKLIKEDWVLENSKAIESDGSKKWLGTLLEGLSSGVFTDQSNPTLATKISERLQGEHEPLVTREMWIQANEKMIKELGADEWLWRFIDVLETGGPTS